MEISSYIPSYMNDKVDKTLSDVKINRQEEIKQQQQTIVKDLLHSLDIKV